MNLRLGRKAIKTDSRTLKMAAYVTSQLPPAPVSRDWTKGVTLWGQFLNDKLGCCTIAGVAHAVQVFSLNASTGVAITDDEILCYYERWDGYNPVDPSTDQGGVELDVLTKWQKSEFAGHQLIAFATVSLSNLEHVKQAINIFGGVYIGISLPTSAQGQTVWDVDNTAAGAPNSWGGHCVFVPAYDENGLTCITWGSQQKMTWNFWSKYVDEAYALISPDFIAASGLAPNGFDLAQLHTDLSQIH